MGNQWKPDASLCLTASGSASGEARDSFVPSGFTDSVSRRRGVIQFEQQLNTSAHNKYCRGHSIDKSSPGGDNGRN